MRIRTKTQPPLHSVRRTCVPHRNARRLLGGWMLLLLGMQDESGGKSPAAHRCTRLIRRPPPRPLPPGRLRNGLENFHPLICIRRVPPRPETRAVVLFSPFFPRPTEERGEKSKASKAREVKKRQGAHNRRTVLFTGDARPMEQHLALTRLGRRLAPLLLPPPPPTLLERVRESHTANWCRENVEFLSPQRNRNKKCCFFCFHFEKI